MALSYETHDLWRFFWHSISLQKKSSIFHIFPTHETDYPYRWSKSLVVRLPWTTYGLVLGWWRNTDRTEEEAILAGMSGRSFTRQEYIEEFLDV